MVRTCVWAAQQQEPRLHTHLRPLSCSRHNKRRGVLMRAADQILLEGRELSIRRQRLARGEPCEHERIPARGAHRTVQLSRASASPRQPKPDLVGSDQNNRASASAIVSAKARLGRFRAFGSDHAVRGNGASTSVQARSSRWSVREAVEAVARSAVLAHVRGAPRLLPLHAAVGVPLRGVALSHTSQPTPQMISALWSDAAVRSEHSWSHRSQRRIDRHAGHGCRWQDRVQASARGRVRRTQQ